MKNLEVYIGVLIAEILKDEESEKRYAEFMKDKIIEDDFIKVFDTVQKAIEYARKNKV